MSTALVLSAGGMFGAWEVGVWKALRGQIHFDMVVGASAGALIGWAIAADCPAEELAEEWLDPRTAQILRFLRPAALYAKAQDCFERYRPRVPFGLTVMEVPRFQTRLVRDGAIKWQHLAATASIPGYFPPVAIDGHLYIDGGFPGNALPLWAAEDMGATRAIAVMCLTTWPFRVMRRVLPPRGCSPKLRVIRIEPSEPLGSLVDVSVWKASNIARWIKLGERDANRALLSITM